MPPTLDGIASWLPRGATRNPSEDTVTLSDGRVFSVGELERNGYRVDHESHDSVGVTRWSTRVRHGGERLTPYSPTRPSRASVLASGGLDLDEGEEPISSPHEAGTVHWALTQMRQGLRVSRKAWDPRAMLWIREGSTEEELAYWSPSDPMAQAMGVVFTIDDVEATDWILVEGADDHP